MMLIAMTFAMTVPMVAWMRYRGHSWRPSTEMAASMVVPMMALLALLWTGLMTDSATLMAVLHAVMLPSMLIAMLMRRDEYTGHDSHVLHESAA
jgi:peptidoglycan/LPS O-acetylase OafA/YrhL